jgi:hypothetical protein
MSENKDIEVAWSEERLQQECFRWFWNTYPQYRGLLFHVPNGGTRNSREAAKLKTMGVVRGVSDFILLFDGTAYCIELKRPDGKGSQSKSQKGWESTVRDNGFRYYVINSLKNFQGLVSIMVGSGFSL